jgi:hypothetical protein
MKPTLAAAVFVNLALAPAALGQTLTNVQTFLRCYAQITQSVAPSNHPLVTSVTNGSDPITACLSVLDKARFSALDSTRINNTSDTEAKNVLRTFHKLHTSWFEKKSSPSVGNGSSAANTLNIFDQETPALYYTRALFRPSTSFNSVLRHATSLKALRPEAPVNGPGTGRPKSDTIFKDAAPWANIGELLGAAEYAPGERKAPFSYVLANGATVTTPLVDFGEHYGGGFLGEQVYLLQTIGQSRDFKANGAAAMPRKFSRAVFNDALCRSLPVVRTEDAVAYVAPTSNVPFRNSSGCVRCHVSMDRMSASIRNMVYIVRGGAGPPDQGFETVVRTLDPAEPAAADWPTAADANYHRRPTKGVLYYRAHDGSLVDVSVPSLAALGEAITNKDDFYVCAAKRYYQYFTGVDVNIGDIHDPSAGIFLTARDEFHRNRVISLGLQLKQTQSARSLIESILRMSSYKRQDFGAGLSQ